MVPPPLAAPLLALDTSTPTARVALLAPDGVCRAQAERAAERHASVLLPLCDQVLTSAGVRIADLGAIACGAGPGSFTGLRVGLAVAKGLALPTGLPLVLISSLAALAEDLAALGGGDVLLAPVLDAGKGEVHGQLFRAGAGGLQALGPERTALPGDLARWIAGEAASRRVHAGGVGLDRHQEAFRAVLGTDAVRPAVPGPSALSVGRLALARLARGERDDLAGAVPSYGRPPDITRPRPR